MKHRRPSGSYKILVAGRIGHHIQSPIDCTFCGGQPILSHDNKQTLLRRLRRVFAWGRLRIGFGFRTMLGLLLVIGGIFGFLPVLGFWMIPVGAALVSLDVPPLRRRLQSWLHNGIRPRRRWQGLKSIGRRKEEK